MKKLLLLIALFLGVAQSVHAQDDAVILKDSIVGSKHLTAGTLWKLVGFVYVVDGATLTIDPGTLIVGDKASKGTLIIERGGKINAQGTAEKPIVFTSELDPGQRATGDWGGIIICGRAPINVPGGEQQIEGGPRSKYGGNIPSDNSGLMSYVRIEFPGIAISPNNETNGLTMGGVGSLTIIDHIQVSYGGDDGYEWFGGLVNAKYLIGFKSLDDDWDTDFGWQGKVQFAVSMRDPNIADVSKSNGFEADNNSGGTPLTPRSRGVFSNMTLVGPQPDTNTAGFNSLYGNAVHHRRATLQSIHNSIIMGWPGVLLLDGAAVTNAANGDTMQIRNMIVAGARFGKTYQTNSGNPFNVAAWFNKAAHGNRVYGQPAEAMLEDPFNLTNPNWTPKSGSPAATGASFTSTNLADAFFASTTYVGAFDPNGSRWDADWTEYDPVSAIYTGHIASLVSQVIFPNTSSGANRDSAVVVLRNPGLLPLTISSVNILGSTEFTTQNVTFPLTVAGKETATITIRYSPTAAGADSALMTVTASNGNKMDVVLKGSSVVTAPKMVIFPPNAAVNFGLVANGESVDNNILEISNTGNAPLSLSGIAISGADAANFTIVSGGADQQLAPAGKQKVNIRFTPSSIGDKTAKLTFTHNDGAQTSPKEIMLLGKGINPFVGDILKDSVAGNVTLTNDRTYLIRGFVYVVNGATLNIEPGTVLYGEKSTKGTLIIERGGKIVADGTECHPIVMTSQEPAGQRSNGDWGGLIICGRAPINVNNTLNGGQIVGGEAQIEGGPRSKYGGNDPNDNSGILRYVRIEFSGIPLSPNNETNTLTMGGIGSGTIIDHVQASYGGDDAFEWFGGTVNAKHLVSIGTIDDVFDTDFGWSGNVQFAVNLSDPNIADVSLSNGFESDNNGTGSFATPRTKAVFSNVTLVGPLSEPTGTANALYGNALHIRRSSQQSIFNSVFMGFPGGILMDGTGVTNGATNDTVVINNNILAGIPAGKEFKTNSGNPFNTQAWFETASHANRKLTTSAEVMLENPFALTSPDWKPKAGSPAESGAAFANSKLQNAFFTPTTYVGAFDPAAARWDACWSNYDPKNTVYAPKAELGLTSVDLGQVILGSSKEQTATAVIKNTGTLTMRVTDLRIEGTNASDFSVVGPTTPFTVLAGESRDIQLKFTPGAVGARSASLVITHNASTEGTSTLTVALSGEGMPSGSVRGSRSASGVVLAQSVPNPSKDRATIAFELPKQMHVRLELVDVTGRVVASLAQGMLGAGDHSVAVETSSLPEGVYIYRLSAGAETLVKSLIVLH